MQALTQQALLAMPEDDYMNDAQLAFFRHLLDGMKADILQHGDETVQHLREAESLPDPADQATVEEEHALDLRARDRERKLLKKITDALARVDDGSYGFCDETGEPIGLRRLLARPTANLTVEAQTRREIQQKQYAD